MASFFLKFQAAVEMYKKIGKPKDAILMFLSRGKIEEAHQYAETFVKSDEIKAIFRKEAQVMVTGKRYAEAEKYVSYVLVLFCCC